MTKYYFLASNWILFVITFILSIMFFGALIMFVSKQGILPNDKLLTMIFTLVGLFVFIFYMIRLTSYAKIEVTLSENSISIKWLEQFLFIRKKNITISFKEIVTYVNQSDINWDWLKIELTDGNIYRLWHSGFLFKDDYHKFVSDFISSVNHFNRSIADTTENKTSNLKAIYRAKSIYETNGGLILAGLSIVIIVGLPILLLFFEPKRLTNYFLFAPGYFGAVYFFVQTLNYRHASKKNNFNP